MKCNFFKEALRVGLSLVLAFCICAHAQQPPSRFDISGFAVEGAPLLKSEDFSRLVSPFIGRQKTLADIQKAQQVVQQAYLDLGYCSAQVTLPKAEPEAGTVTLRIVQAAVPIGKDCLPMVVLDSDTKPLAVAPGEVAVRPLNDPTRATAEVPAPASGEPPSRIARAPLKPLQDRQPSARASQQAQPQSPGAALPVEAPPAVIVQSLAQAPLQPGLSATPPLAPAPAEQPVVAEIKPAPSAVVPPSASAPKPEVASVPAAPSIDATTSARPAPRSTETASAALNIAPTAPVETPKIQAAMEPTIAPRVPPVAQTPTPQVIAAAPEATEHSIAAPAPSVAVPIREKLVPESIVVAPSKDVNAPADLEPARARAPLPQPAVESSKEVAVEKSPPAALPESRPVDSVTQAARSAPALIAAAPVEPAVQPQPATVPSPAIVEPPKLVPSPSAAPIPPPSVESPKAVAEMQQPIAAPRPAPVEQPAPASKSQVEMVAVAPTIQPAREPPVEKPSPPADLIIAAPKPEPATTAATLPQTTAVKPTPAVVATVEPKKEAAALPDAIVVTPTEPSHAQKPVAGADAQPLARKTQAESQTIPKAPAEKDVDVKTITPIAEMTPGLVLAPKAEANTAPQAPRKKTEVTAQPVPVTEKPAAVPVPAAQAESQAARPLPSEKAVTSPAPQAEQPRLVDAPVKPAMADVEVRALAGATVPVTEPREPATPAPERAPIRQLQDRQPPSEPPTAIADASPAKPAAKPAPVVVQAAPAPVAEPPAAGEPTAAPAALKFDIERYLVEGNTLLNADDISKVLAAYTGKQKDFADVQKALEALQIAYQQRGWGVVQVSLPEQELERGEVRFEVTETKIGKVQVQGNEYFSEANVRRSVPSLKEGETPNSLAMARSLRVANDNPVKQTQVSLKAGSNEGEVDATIKVVDDSPRKYSASFDNTGTDSTGRFRAGVGFQHANLWDRDHQLTFQYLTNPEHPSRVTILGAGYHIPLYARGDSIDLVLGYSDVDSGVVQQLFNVSGAGFIALGRYNMNLKRIEDYEHKLTFGIDYKAFQSRVLTTSGVGLVPDITLHPLSLAYSGELRDEKNALTFYTSFSYNAFEGGNDAAQSDFKASRGSAGGASAEYAIWRAGINYQRLLPEDFSFRFAANAQTTRNALVAGEQFGVGGANSVRGFNERVYSNDKGHQATFELISPELASKIGFDGGRLRVLAFYDTAVLSRNFIQPGEQTGLGIDSVGLGLRMSYRERLSLRLDYAQVLHDGGQDAGLRDGRRNSNTFHASALFVY